MFKPVPPHLYYYFQNFRQQIPQASQEKKLNEIKTIFLKILHYRKKENDDVQDIPLKTILQYISETQVLLSYPIHSIICCPSQIPQVPDASLLKKWDLPQYPPPSLYAGIASIHPPKQMGVIVDKGYAFFITLEEILKKV